MCGRDRQTRGSRECVVCRAPGDDDGDKHKAQACRVGSQQERPGSSAGRLHRLSPTLFQTAAVTVKWTVQPPSFREVQRMSQGPETVKHTKTQNGVLTSQGLQQQTYLLYAFQVPRTSNGSTEIIILH